VTHQPISLRSNHDDRFARRPAAQLVRALHELPWGATVTFREQTYVRRLDGLWDNGFRPLLTADLARAIGTDEYTAVTPTL
jgi:hypothetical protein